MVVVEELWRIDMRRVDLFIYYKDSDENEEPIPVGERNHEIVRYSTLSLAVLLSFFSFYGLYLAFLGEFQ